ncbi:MAG: hypothetical protein NC548_26300 [Lachnospiraceae bacterium]|nr:hypothetical protein [Lachnospiraceae bacterium]
MRKFNVAISLLYIALLVVIVICVPLSAILLICKACDACAASWLGCCVPLLVALAAAPLFTFAKIILDNKEGK